MRIKKSISFEKLLIDAGNKRLNDLDFYEEIKDDTKALSIVSEKDNYLSVRIPNLFEISDSGKEIEQIKNCKLFTNIMNGKLKEVKEFNEFFQEDIYEELDGIQKRAAELSSLIDESEIKILEEASKVHSNDFVKKSDQNDIEKSSVFNFDVKTGSSFSEEEFCEVIDGVGALLPYESRIEIKPSKAYIVFEKTDVGETRVPIKVDPIKNILKQKKIFRYIVLRKENLNYSKLYKKETSFNEYPYSCTSNFTFGLDFNTISFINTIKISSCSSIGYEVKSIKALIDGQKWIELEFDAIEVSEKIELFFPPLSTSSIEITLEQKNIVGRGNGSSADKEKSTTNKRLSAMGFVSKYESLEEDESGYYQDFSIKLVEAGLVKFKRKGAFLSQPIRARGMYSLGCASDSMFIAEDLIKEVSDYQSAINEGQIKVSESLIELYGCINLYGGNRESFSSVFPFVQSGITNKEFVIPSSEFSRINLFPDLRSECKKIEVESFNLINLSLYPEYEKLNTKKIYIVFNKKEKRWEEKSSSFYPSDAKTRYDRSLEEEANRESSLLDFIKINLKEKHGLKAGDDIVLFSKNKKFGGKTKVVKVEDESSIAISAVDVGIYSVEELSSIFTDSRTFSVYIAKYEDPSFVLERDGKKLEIKKDYEISLDGGSNWFSFWPVDSSYEFFYEDAKSLNFFIRLKEKSSESYCICEYKHLRDQKLSEKGEVYLENNIIKLKEEYKKYNADVRTFVIFRAESPEVYNSPILLNYDLKIYEKEIKETSSTNNRRRSNFIFKKRRSSKNGIK